MATPLSKVQSMAGVDDVSSVDQQINAALWNLEKILMIKEQTLRTHAKEDAKTILDALDATANHLAAKLQTLAAPNK